MDLKFVRQIFMEPTVLFGLYQLAHNMQGFRFGVLAVQLVADVVVEVQLGELLEHMLP